MFNIQVLNNLKSGNKLMLLVWRERQEQYIDIFLFLPISGILTKNNSVVKQFYFQPCLKTINFLILLVLF